jgi:hypothetical protein
LLRSLAHVPSSCHGSLDTNAFHPAVAGTEQELTRVIRALYKRDIINLKLLQVLKGLKGCKSREMTTLTLGFVQLNGLYVPASPGNVGGT